MSEQQGTEVSSPSPITDHPSQITAPPTHYVPLLLNLAALGVICLGTFQLDGPLITFMRSLHVFWLERVGDLFYLIGTGGGLVTISGFLLVAGYLLKDARLLRSGFESLVAHGAVALVVQSIKHLIGRPRPRLMRDDEFFTGPSLGSGLDSFPSGHAAASFGVATVVARHFPRLAWGVYGLAGLIAGSRVVRGSHFATDVAVGAILGTLAGSVVAGSLREWQASVYRAIAELAPSLTVGFAILWVLCHPVLDPAQDAMMLWTGSLALALGVGSRWGAAFRGEPTVFFAYGKPVIALGLAFTTGSWVVVLISSLVVGGQWLAAAESRVDFPAGTSRRVLIGETAWAFVLAIAVLVLQGVKGALAPA